MSNETAPYRRNNEMSPKDFLMFANRISTYIDFKGCRTEKCINKRIKEKNSKQLNGLIEAGFAYRLLLESWLNPHPIYREMLGISDEEYVDLVEEKRRANSSLE
ncbi:MAG: hypothetical protein ACTSW1_15570 [Candidatus Hodarchaeales archaeon]